MNNAVGKHIGKLRRERGLSQEQLAEKLSVTRQAVSNWETGRTQPSLEILEALAKAFEVELLTVIYGQPPVTEETAEDTAAKAAARKRHLLLAAIWALTTAVWTAVGLRIMQYLDLLRKRQYQALPYLLFRQFVWPFLFFALANALMHGINRIIPIPAASQEDRRRCLIASAALMALYVLAVFWSFGFLPGLAAPLSLARFFVSDFSGGAVFLVSGVLFYLGSAV